MFPTVFSEILKEALEQESVRTTVCRLGIDPTKTEVMPFTAERNIPEFHLPQLSEQIQSLSSNIIFLASYVKLNSRLNIEM